MYRFIFVCYQHGTGGERLSVDISLHEKCNNLPHDEMASRTWTYDYFDKLFLKPPEIPFNDNWKMQCKDITSSDLADVVPSHYRPERIREVFPNELYVVINTPKTSQQWQDLRKKVYEKVWKTKHENIEQKIGYWKTHTDREITKDIFKKLNQDVTNEDIQFMIHNLEKNATNLKTIFDKNFNTIKTFDYQNDEHTIVIEYDKIEDRQNRLSQVIQRLDSV
tara:strand:- start:396 stop:1058 length:663 start_codon:yes stop_codon:yes gene_type:complete